MDELFETATLMQTGKIEDFPLVLMGRDFWEPMLAFLRDTMVAEGTIAAEDYHSIFVTDSPEEAVARIREAAGRNPELRWEPARARHVLGERGVAQR